MIALTKLETLVMHSNQLGGPLPNWSDPESSGHLGIQPVESKTKTPTTPQIRILDLGDNQFVGTISIGFLLSSYEVFNVSLNSLTGTIPGMIRHVTSLQTLQLQNNQLTGVIPNLHLLSRLREFCTPVVGFVALLAWIRSLADIVFNCFSLTEIASFEQNGLMGTVDYLCLTTEMLTVDCESVTCSCCDGCR